MQIGLGDSEEEMHKCSEVHQKVPSSLNLAHSEEEMHAVVAGIRTWDFLRHVHLSYHLTYTSLVIRR